jgi:ATP-dependent Lon protease
VLSVGGIKEKVLAAHRSGLQTVILPRRNEADLEDLPEEVRKEMQFVLADSLDDVLEAALAPAEEAAPEQAATAEPVESVETEPEPEAEKA